MPRRVPLLHTVAPTLAVILAYFGVGSFTLSVEILARFPDGATVRVTQFEALKEES